jgi:hypothetical protein
MPVLIGKPEVWGLRSRPYGAPAETWGIGVLRQARALGS